VAISCAITSHHQLQLHGAQGLLCATERLVDAGRRVQVDPVDVLQARVRQRQREGDRPLQDVQVQDDRRLALAVPHAHQAVVLEAGRPAGHPQRIGVLQRRGLPGRMGAGAQERLGKGRVGETDQGHAQARQMHELIVSNCVTCGKPAKCLTGAMRRGATAKRGSTARQIPGLALRGGVPAGAPR
jgi:hypothetical protein